MDQTIDFIEFTQNLYSKNCNSKPFKNLSIQSIIIWSFVKFYTRSTPQKYVLFVNDCGRNISSPLYWFSLTKREKKTAKKTALTLTIASNNYSCYKNLHTIFLCKSYNLQILQPANLPPSWNEIFNKFVSYAPWYNNTELRERQ